MILAKPWSHQEDAAIRARYLTDGAAPLSAELGRSLSAVFHRANRLRVTKNRLWTQREDSTLRNNWGDCTLGELAALLSRSTLTTYWRAQKLGLPLGCPQGYEYLSDAAERCGYTVKQLRRILRWGGVKLRRTMSRNERNSGRVRHIVQPQAVNDVVSRWHKTEPVEAAARRRGLCGDTLRRWLENAAMAGMRLPAKPRRHRAHWRIESAVIDAVVAARAAGLRRAA